MMIDVYGEKNDIKRIHKAVDSNRLDHLSLMSSL